MPGGEPLISRRQTPVLDPRRLRAVFRQLLRTYGPQYWWPGDSPFEVMVGAVLTQNTAWINVERGLERLCRCIPLEASAILASSPERLAECLRPVGYFNLKSRRLQAFCQAYLSAGGLDGLRAMETEELRELLLRIHGVGPETADDILLYALERPVFVVDAYTRRIFERLGILQGGESYEAVRHGFEAALGLDVALFNQYHALIVRHGKDVCRPRPRCTECCLGELCTWREALAD